MFVSRTSCYAPKSKKKIIFLSAAGCERLLKKYFNGFIQIRHSINEGKGAECGRQGKNTTKNEKMGNPLVASTKITVAFGQGA